MRVELPFLAEGVEGGDVVQLLVREGDQVTEGQSLIELETEKATVPVPAPAAGRVARLLVRQGDHVKVGQALVELDGAEAEARGAKTPATEKPAVPPAPQSAPAEQAAPAKSVERREEPKAKPSAPPSPDTEQPATERTQPEPISIRSSSAGAAIPASPSVRRLARELSVDLTQVKGSEAGGRITAEDVKAF